VRRHSRPKVYPARTRRATQGHRGPQEGHKRATKKIYRGFEKNTGPQKVLKNIELWFFQVGSFRFQVIRFGFEGKDLRFKALRFKV
jgi:hypothetical protein